MRMNMKVVDKPQCMPPTQNFVEISATVFKKNEMCGLTEGHNTPITR
jgi:hypothetical protein